MSLDMCIKSRDVCDEHVSQIQRYVPVNVLLTHVYQLFGCVAVIFQCLS